jgi:hypothetical protein
MILKVTTPQKPSSVRMLLHATSSHVYKTAEAQLPKIFVFDFQKTTEGIRNLWI